MIGEVLHTSPERTMMGENMHLENIKITILAIIATDDDVQVHTTLLLSAGVNAWAS